MVPPQGDPQDMPFYLLGYAIKEVVLSQSDKAISARACGDLQVMECCAIIGSFRELPDEDFSAKP